MIDETCLHPETLARPPLVSVLIPSYNHSKYLGSCLDSIILDGYSNLEIRLLDDGSTDDSLDIANAWRLQNLSRFQNRIYIGSQSNQGLPSTLNRLVSQSQGKYFVLLASDDELLTGGIASRVDYLVRNPAMLAVVADAIGIDSFGRQTYASVIQEKYKADVRALQCDKTRELELILQWCVPGPVFMAHRWVVEGVGTYDPRFMLEDRNFCLRLIALGVLGFLNTRVARYRVHDGSQVGNLSNQSKMLKELARVDVAMTPQFRGLRYVAMRLRTTSYAFRVVGTDVRTVRPGLEVVIRFFARCAVLSLRSVNRWCAIGPGRSGDDYERGIT